MAVNILSTNEILTYIQNFIKAKNPHVDVQIGSDLYDLILHGNAQASSRIFEELDNVENLQSIFTTFNDDLDLVARNYNLSRKRSTFSTGYVTFYTVSFSSDIIIPDGTIISTKGTANVSGVTFETIGDYSIIYADRSSYFNALQGRYEITVPIRSTVPGLLSNINSNTISVVQSTVSEIEGCVNNNPTTGGTDGETDQELQNRCALSWVVSSVGTRDGYSKLLLDQEEVSDAFPVGPFDEDSVRQGEGIDIYCITTSALSNNEQIITYSNNDYTVLTKQPVVDVVKIEDITAGYTIIPNVSYYFNKQIDNPFSGSTIADATTARIDWIDAWNGNVKEVLIQPNTFTFSNSGAPAPIQATNEDAYKNTRITFNTGANVGVTRTVTGFSYDAENAVATFVTNDFPANITFNDSFTLNPRPSFGNSVKFQYTYNSDIFNLQDFMDQSSKKVIGGNVLIKNGYRGKLYLDLSIKLFPGYNFNTVRNKVEGALVQYLSELKLGDDIQISDLLVVAQTGQGTDFTIVEVDYVSVNTSTDFSYVERWNDLIQGFDSNGVISMENREYIILQSLTIGQI